MPRDFDVCVSKAEDLFFSLAERVAIYEITSPTSVHQNHTTPTVRPYQCQKVEVFLFLLYISESTYYSLFTNQRVQ